MVNVKLYVDILITIKRIYLEDISKIKYNEGLSRQQLLFDEHSKTSTTGKVEIQFRYTLCGKKIQSGNLVIFLANHKNKIYVQEINNRKSKLLLQYV